MGRDKYGPETSHEERTHRRLQIVYARKTHERRIFMQELKEIRKERDKRLMKTIKESIGPKWYQVLGVIQRQALDSLEFAIYQDLLEGRPTRTRAIMKLLGLYPRPNTIDLMNCVFLGRHDPKEMLAQLFLMTFGHSIDGREESYSLNARLMLSGILYLGYNNLISLLRDRFRSDTKDKEPAPPRKPKSKPKPKSPYLQKMIAALYEAPQRKPFKPAPLPNLDELNDPLAYQEDEAPAVYKPPPPPPPPPPPKKRLPRSYCDKIAGVMTIEPHSSIPTLNTKSMRRGSQRKLRSSKLCLSEVKKPYGISGSKGKGGRRRKPVAPSTGMSNAQYLISGVCQIHGKSVFILGNVSILPAIGDLIHGGYKYMGNEYINIHCGFRARPPPPKPDPCDCVKKWQNAAFDYVKRTKCYCGHRYDYGNEGTYPPDDLQFFQKPTRNTPFAFNYHTIYDMDEKRLYVEKEFKKIWDTDSVLHIDDGTVKDKKDKKKKKTKRSSTTCLGQNPKPEDYLKCALRMMKQLNLAARLPDVHLVPELKEWMRRRIYGPCSSHVKAEKMRKSSIYWQKFNTLAMNGYGHVYPPKDDRFYGDTNWVHKLDLQQKFRKYTQQYRLELFRSHAYVNNLMWPSMCQAQFPDKKFREIYFSYLWARIEDMQLMHPYSPKESAERKFTMARRRYVCLPAGTETLE